MRGRVGAGVQECAGGVPRYVCAVVRGCLGVCAGVCGCLLVYTSVHEYALVCTGVRGCVRKCLGVSECVCGMNFQNTFWRIESLHQRSSICILYEFLIP